MGNRQRIKEFYGQKRKILASMEKAALEDVDPEDEEYSHEYDSGEDLASAEEAE